MTINELESEARAGLSETQGQRYGAVLNHPTELTAVLEAIRNPAGAIVDWRYSDANLNYLSALQRTREELIGHTLTEVLSGQADQLNILCARVLQERSPHRYETAMGMRQFAVCLFPVDDNTVVSSGVDITSRVQLARDLEQRSEADRAEREWLSAVLNSLTEEVYFTDTQRRYTYANPAAMREFSHSAVSGIPLEEIVSRLEVLRADGTPRPMSEAPPLRALAGEIVIDEEQLVRIPRTGELRHRQVSSAPVRDARGTIIGAVSVVRDITERKRMEAELRARERRFGMLLQLSDRFRDLTDPVEVARAAVQLLAQTLDVSCCGFSAADGGSLTLSNGEWYCHSSQCAAQSLQLTQYGPDPEQLHRGHAIVCNDTQTDLRTRPRAATLTEHGVRAFVLCPVTEQSSVVAVLSLAHDAPRLWTDDELAMIREVAERTHVAVERRRGERAAAADLRDTRLLHELAARQISGSDENELFDEIVAAAMTITQAEGGTIQLLEEHSQVLTFAATRGLPAELTSQFEHVTAASTSPCGIALATGKRTLLDFDVDDSEDGDGTLRLHRDHGLLSAQSMPLMSRSGRLLGVLSTHWKTRRVSLSEREVRFLDLLGRQAADLIERLRTEHSLRASEQQLREGARRKDEFLAVLAHELRNPLAALSAASALLTRAEQKPEIVTRARDALQRQIHHMARLLDDLLDMARITNGIIQLRMTPIDLADIVSTACETVRPLIEAHQHTLRLHVADATYVYGDAVRLSQIISNLLTNSAKYTPEGGVIEVSLVASPDQAIVSISDNGVGISPDLLPRIFDMFSQEVRSHETSGGLGIGLALAKGLVQLHNGHIEVTSAGKGQGSTFTVKLPLLLSPANRIAAVTRDTGQPSLRPMNILIADDNREIAQSWSVLLEQSGHTVHTAFDGEAALTQAARVRPDAILLDIGMPKLDGYQVAEAIRAQAWGSRTLLIAITGWAQASDRERARAAGFDHHVAKPATFDEIERILRSVAG